jgi:hypothetical protein
LRERHSFRSQIVSATFLSRGGWATRFHCSIVIDHRQFMKFQGWNGFEMWVVNIMRRTPRFDHRMASGQPTSPTASKSHREIWRGILIPDTRVRTKVKPTGRTSAHCLDRPRILIVSRGRSCPGQLVPDGDRSSRRTQLINLFARTNSVTGCRLRGSSHTKLIAGSRIERHTLPNHAANKTSIRCLSVTVSGHETDESVQQNPSH